MQTKPTSPGDVIRAALGIIASHGARWGDLDFGAAQWTDDQRAVVHGHRSGKRAAQERAIEEFGAMKGDKVIINEQGIKNVPSAIDLEQDPDGTWRPK